MKIDLAGGLIGGVRVTAGLARGVIAGRGRGAGGWGDVADETRTNAETEPRWIELRDTDRNKLHGRFDCTRQLLEVRRGRFEFVFDLAESSRRGYPVIVSSTTGRGGKRPQ